MTTDTVNVELTPHLIRLLADIAYATCGDEEMVDDTTSAVTFDSAVVYMTTDDYELLRSLVERFYPSEPIPCRPVQCAEADEVTITGWRT